jgi:hypothetical protein
VKCRNFFYPKLCGTVWAPRQKWRLFSWTLEVLISGIFKIWKKCQNPEILRSGFWHFFQIFRFVSTSVFQLFLFFHPLLCRSMMAPSRKSGSTLHGL